MRKSTYWKRRHFSRATLLTVLAALLFSPPLFAAEKDAKNSAVLERLKKDMKYLASDDLEGRGVGTDGLNKAAEFIRDEFEKAGLDVTRVDGGAFHHFKMTTGSKLGKHNSLTFVGKDGKDVQLKLDADCNPCSFGRTGTFDGQIVFLGYGIHAPSLKYSDYKDVDLKGKVAIIMRRNPQQGNPHSPFRGRRGRTYAALRHKYTEAFNRGAEAVLFVNDPYTTKRESQRRTKLVAKAKEAVVKAAEELAAEETVKSADKTAAARKKLIRAVNRLKNVRRIVSGNVDELMKFGYGGRASRSKDPRPIFHITQAACNRLLKSGLNKTLEELAAEIDKNGEPKSLAVGDWTAKGEVTLTPIEEKVKNVIGVLEGEGPLSEQTIIVGAHYDHVGYGRYGSRAPGSKAVHNGADDNASGTVALIELARRLAARKEKLPRRIVFIAFTAEELGLVGSARYAEKPVIPLKKTIAMFNMDMVGRLRAGKLTVFAVGSSPYWKPLLEKHGKSTFKNLSLKNELFPRSDHASFVRSKVPALQFFTNTHSDYHRPSDDWQKINFGGIADVVDFVEKCVVETAGRKERPKFVKIVPKKVKRTTSRWPYFGSQPDYSKQVDGLYVNGATKGSPAAKAGLKAGDVVVKFGRFKVSGIREYAHALSQYKAGDTVEFVVKRKGKEVKLQATLEKPR